MRLDIEGKDHVFDAEDGGNEAARQALTGEALFQSEDCQFVVMPHGLMYGG